MSADGKALGVLSTLGLAPLPASNNIGDLAKELAFAQAHSGIAGLEPGQRHRAVLADPLTPRPSGPDPGGVRARRPARRSHGDRA